MPQGRRKVPFSGKAKKVQLQMKRERKEETAPRNEASLRRDARPVRPEGDSVERHGDAVVRESKSDMATVLSEVQLRGRGGHRYELMFHEDSKQEIYMKRERARQPLRRLKDGQALSVDLNTFYPPTVDFPRRPPWDSSMSKQAVEANEAKYFHKYVSKLMDSHTESKLSYFELNLETWRQLWRVIEMSDILLFIVDIRCPTFPPSLYDFVNEECRDKHLILVLNKVDLIPAGLALAWKDYFERKFPNLSVVFFSSCPTYNLHGGLITKTGLKFRRLRGRISMVAEGARSIFEKCQQIAKADPDLRDLDLQSWWKKIEAASGGGGAGNDDAHHEVVGDEHRVFTLGTIGHPNVGKSSLINSLMGKKVVSVSKTPGHTKHFQTIFLSPAVKLCDCPGLVFPSIMPKELQVLQGSYPIAQTREPLSIVQFLAERVDVPYMLGLTHPENSEAKWSAFDICEAWATKRGYTTARTNRPDVYRAANHILRMTLDGKITLQFTPPNYDDEFWQAHPDLVQIRNLLGLESEAEAAALSDFSDDDEDVDNEVSGAKVEPGDEEEDGSEDDDEDEGAASVVSNKFALLNEECDD